MARLFENWPNFLHELAGKLGQDLATLPNTGKNFPYHKECLARARVRLPGMTKKLVSTQ